MKEREKSAPHAQGRHEKFQFGTNPMAMTEFEKAQVRKEVEWRKENQRRYIEGIQGRDGGYFPHQQYEDFCPDKF